MTNKTIQLTKTEKDDLEFLFQFQLDQEAIYLAALHLTIMGHKKYWKNVGL